MMTLMRMRRMLLHLVIMHGRRMMRMVVVKLMVRVMMRMMRGRRTWSHWHWVVVCIILEGHPAIVIAGGREFWVKVT